MPEIARAPEAAPAPKSSIGTSSLSVLFLPQQASRLREAVIAYEKMDHTKPPVEAVNTPVNVPVKTVEVIKEPAEYPVFYLSTIVYDAPNEWSIWVAGHKITSKKNDTNVKVLSVTPNAVTFEWTPEYAKLIQQRIKEHAMASLDDVKHRLSSGQAVTQNAGTGAITFTLRQNQAFAVGYFGIFEGYIDSPKMAPLSANVAPTTDFTMQQDGGGMSAAGPTPYAMPPGGMPPNLQGMPPEMANGADPLTPGMMPNPTLMPNQGR